MAKGKLFFEEFSSPYLMAEAVKNRKNNGFFGHSSDREGGSFSGTESYMEAERLLAYGDESIAARIEQGLACVRASAPRNVTQTVYDVRGSAPSVGRYIAGHPRSMMRRETVKRPQASARLVFDSSENCNVEAEDLLRAGVTALQLVYILEAAHVRTELSVCSYACDMRQGDRGLLLTRLKAGQEPLDVLKIAYPLAHPSFFRRHSFRWAETLAGVTHHVSGYGSHLDKERTEAALKEAGRGDHLLINYSDCRASSFDAKRLAERLGIKLS